MNKTNLVAVFLLLSLILSGCSSQERQEAASETEAYSVEEAEAIESDKGEDTPEDPLRKTEELLQGTWEYYVPSTGFKEVLVFDNGKVTQDLTVKEYDYSGSSVGSYEVRENYIAVSLDGYKDTFNYSTRDDKMNLSLTVTHGIDEGTTRKYLQTSKGTLSQNGHSANVENISDSLSESNGAEQNNNSLNATAGERNALDKALQYLNYSAFSYSGLISQLEYEGYTRSEATYAADNCGADWKEQAAAKALSYLEYSAFSYNGLIDQLEYEGFSSSEAKYGADNCGADWNEQAAKKAKQYLEYSSFSRSELIDQLIFEGFTQSQAEYGANRAY